MHPHVNQNQDDGSTAQLSMNKFYTCTINNYSKTFVKLPLKNRQNKDLNDKW